MRVPTLLPVAAAVALALAAPAGAATVDDVEVIATGLDNPRHLAISPHGGDIYVAESGHGGDFANCKSRFDTAEGDSCTGATGAVTHISRKHWHGHGAYDQERIIEGLASFAPETGDAAIGPHGIFVDGHGLYVTNGGPTAPTRGTPPELVLRDPTLVSEEPVSRLFGTLLRFSKHDRPRLVADLWRFERDNNPDETEGNPEIDSNPVDVFAQRGRVVVADAGGNTILKVGQRGSIRVLSVFPNAPNPLPVGPPVINAVPTGVVAGPDGAYYVSQLTGFPFVVGAANVFRVDPRSGEFTPYATGFTNAMDLAFGRDGTLYVLEIDRDGLLTPDTAEGGLWAVPPGGGAPERIELPAGTLTTPGGIAVGRRGDLYVSNHATTPTTAGGGEVLKIELDR